MKKIARVVAGIILIVWGIGAMSFGGYLLTQSGDWLSLVLFIGIGATFILSGWGIASGDDILDILSELFTNLARW